MSLIVLCFLIFSPGKNLLPWEKACKLKCWFGWIFFWHMYSWAQCARDRKSNVRASFLELKLLPKVTMRGEREKKKRGIWYIRTFKANKANIALLWSDTEIKELALILYLELSLRMQFTVKYGQSGCCLGASPLTCCFPEASDEMWWPES